MRGKVNERETERQLTAYRRKYFPFHAQIRESNEPLIDFISQQNYYKDLAGFVISHCFGNLNDECYTYRLHQQVIHTGCINRLYIIRM
ncbi:hypothetical protein LguiA_012545 [Lonicera macranthoides]